MEFKLTLFALSSQNPQILQDSRFKRKQNIHPNPKRVHTFSNNQKAILKEAKQNSNKYAQGSFHNTFLHNHVNEDQSQKAKGKKKSKLGQE